MFNFNQGSGIFSAKGSVAKKHNQQSLSLDESDDESDNRFIKKLRTTSNGPKKSITSK